MDKSQSKQQTYRTVKQCPCGATVFERREVGEIRDEVFVPLRIVFKCVNCERESEQVQLLDREMVIV